MPVIAIIGNKGGAGKTTLGINLASGLSFRGHTVLLDADPQLSSLQWRQLSDRDDLVAVDDATTETSGIIRQYSESSEYVVVDCPPSIHAEQTRSALENCQLALVPILPSPLDLWATVHVEDELDAARSVNRDLKGLVVINQIEPRTRLSHIVGAALSEISLPVANTAISRRMAFRHAMLDGVSIFQMGARGREAAEEMKSLVEEVINHVQ